MSSSSSGLSVSKSDRDNSGEMTEKLGFSVVAATSVIHLFSTEGSRASCCDLENRCTSSMNNTVSCPPEVSRLRASSMTARTSLTPAVTADSSTKKRPEFRAIRYASVVFPVPGGPHNMTEPGIARWYSPLVSNRRRNGDPGCRRWVCPVTSSTVRGRIRTASGAVGDGSGRPALVLPVESKRSITSA